MIIESWGFVHQWYVQSPLILIHQHTQWPKAAAPEWYNVTLAILDVGPISLWCQIYYFLFKIGRVPSPSKNYHLVNVNMQLWNLWQNCDFVSIFVDVSPRTNHCCSPLLFSWRSVKLESWWFSQLSSVVDPRAENTLMMCIKGNRAAGVDLLDVKYLKKIMFVITKLILYWTNWSTSWSFFHFQCT